MLPNPKKDYLRSFLGGGVCPIFLTAFLNEPFILTRFSAGLVCV
jgi:hypothetical protein